MYSKVALILILLDCGWLCVLPFVCSDEEFKGEKGGCEKQGEKFEEAFLFSRVSRGGVGLMVTHSDEFIEVLIFLLSWGALSDFACPLGEKGGCGTTLKQGEKFEEAFLFSRVSRDGVGLRVAQLYELIKVLIFLLS